jgi:hypothetical protein
MKLLILVIAIILSACSTVSAQKGDWKFTRTSFGTMLGVGKLAISEDGPGKMTVELDGLKSDQVEFAKAVAEGAAKGAAEGVKKSIVPVP